MAAVLDGVRVLDLTWVVAGPTGARYLAALGAEVIRVEWIGRLDFMRLGPPSVTLPGEEASGVTTLGGGTPDMVKSVNRNGVFNDFNAGKRGISLNLSRPEGKEILLRLVAMSDVLIESYSSSAMENMGLGLEVLRQANPDLVYIQASGFGAIGDKRDYVTFGPTAQAVTGLTHQSGLPDREPSGWGFSYMDHTGGYYVALATLMALLQRKRTGRPVYMDLAQAQAGLFITGTSVLDHSANGTETVRTGNRSPFRAAVPHGVYPAAGVDRWVAVAVRTDDEWSGLVRATGITALADPRAADRGRASPERGPRRRRPRRVDTEPGSLRDHEPPAAPRGPRRGLSDERRPRGFRSTTRCPRVLRRPAAFRDRNVADPERPVPALGDACPSRFPDRAGGTLLRGGQRLRVRDAARPGRGRDGPPGGRRHHLRRRP